MHLFLVRFVTVRLTYIFIHYPVCEYIIIFNTSIVIYDLLRFSVLLSSTPSLPIFGNQYHQKACLLINARMIYTHMFTINLILMQQNFTSSVEDKWCREVNFSNNNAAICTTTYLERQKWYGLDKKILFKKILFHLEVKGQGPTKTITIRDTPHLMIMHLHSKYHWPISKDKYAMALTRKYYLKNNYLTIRSKVKDQQRSLPYAAPHYGQASTY